MWCGVGEQVRPDEVVVVAEIAERTEDRRPPPVGRDEHGDDVPGIGVLPIERHPDTHVSGPPDLAADREGHVAGSAGHVFAVGAVAVRDGSETARVGRDRARPSDSVDTDVVEDHAVVPVVPVEVFERQRVRCAVGELADVELVQLVGAADLVLGEPAQTLAVDRHVEAARLARIGGLGVGEPVREGGRAVGDRHGLPDARRVPGYRVPAEPDEGRARVGLDAGHGRGAGHRGADGRAGHRVVGRPAGRFVRRAGVRGLEATIDEDLGGDRRAGEGRADDRESGAQERGSDHGAESSGLGHERLSLTWWARTLASGSVHVRPSHDVRTMRHANPEVQEPGGRRIVTREKVSRAGRPRSTARCDRTGRSAGGRSPSAPSRHSCRTGAGRPSEGRRRTG